VDIAGCVRTAWPGAEEAVRWARPRGRRRSSRAGELGPGPGRVGPDRANADVGAGPKWRGDPGRPSDWAWPESSPGPLPQADLPAEPATDLSRRTEAEVAYWEQTRAEPSLRACPPATLVNQRIISGYGLESADRAREQTGSGVGGQVRSVASDRSTRTNR
jgi:hypothetical protein